MTPQEIFYMSPVTERWMERGAPTTDPIRIIKIICKYFSVSFSELGCKSRKRELVIPRQLCMYFLNKKTTMTLKAIGEMLGGRDHTTVIHSTNLIGDMIETDSKILSIAYDISRSIGSNDNFSMPDKRYRIRVADLIPKPERAQAKEEQKRPPAIYSNYSALGIASGS